MIRLIGLLASSLFAFSALALTPDFYYKRFEIVRENGTAVKIKDKSISLKFSIMPYLKYIKDSLKNEQKLMLSKSTYQSDIVELFEENFSKSERSNEQMRIVLDSLEKLKNINFDAVFENPDFKEVISRFAEKLQGAIEYMDPKVLASLENSSFFYKKAATYEVVKWGLNFAKKRLHQIPLLNTASYVLVQVEKLLREQRTFHQNILMHYLENLDYEKLNLTREEVRKVYSSIYESRIQWFAFWESKKAIENWDRYGIDLFFSNVRSGNARLASGRDEFDSVGERVNYAFIEGEYKGENVYINLYDNESIIKQRAAVAFYRNGPQKVARLRTVLRLAQIGLTYLPLPNWSKTISERFMKSYYETQRITEGALYGYFEANNMVHEKDAIAFQYGNPFDTLTLKD